MALLQRFSSPQYGVLAFLAAFALSALLFSGTAARAVVATDTGPDRALIVLADPTDMTQCKNRGWKLHGFKSQGQCFQFTNTGIDARIVLQQ
jgi:hypothetical protein